jgi:5,10-methylenetetrahydromethanopterin reductase
MRFAIAVPTAADSWRVVRRAEELGFSRAWFFDTQLLNADPFVAMAAAAIKTTTIRLATGVLIPSNRLPAVAANAFASLNKLAPGRIDIGVGTGFTGRRTMGLGAIRLADLEEYVRVVTALLREETVETEIEGQRRAIRLLNPELSLINTRDPIPLYLAAQGPRGRALTARLGAGWINATGNADAGVAAIGDMRKAWASAGRTEQTLDAVAFCGGAVLEPGEPADSPRAIAQAGPRVAMLLHRIADAALSNIPSGMAIPTGLAAAGASYVEALRGSEPEGAAYLENHRGHLMFVKPAERAFITAELIRATTLTAPESELKPRIGALAEAGYHEIAIQIVPGQEHAIEDWGRIRRSFA